MLKKKSVKMALAFQYGSNTSLERMNSHDRMRGDARPVGIAYTENDFELEFSVWSRTNQCAVANILPSSGRKIWGVVYEIPDYLISRETSGVRKSLDAIEGEGQNYRRIIIALGSPNGLPFKNEFITYIGLRRRSGIYTSLEYARHIIRGLREHDVPDDYIEYVKAQILVNNPGLRKNIIVL